MSYGLGKFSSAAEEAIFTIAFDSMWNDDHDGNSDAPTGYFAQLEVNRDDAAAILAWDLVQQQEELPTIDDLVGFWIISESSTGAVYLSAMDDKRSMTDAYEALSNDYSDYLMCQQCAVCGVLLNEYGEDADGGRYCDTDGADAPLHVAIEREV